MDDFPVTLTNSWGDSVDVLLDHVESVVYDDFAVGSASKYAGKDFGRVAKSSRVQ
jgi:hypothetical protein